MLRSFQLLAFLAGASALLVSPLAAPHASQRIAASPQMACNGGKGGSGGEGPPLDKMRRGRLGALIQSADDAEKVKAILISSQTERLLLNMNWKVRSSMQRQLRKRAAQFGVEVPMDFAAYNVRPRNTPKKASLLVMSALRPSGGPGCTGCPAQSQGLWNPLSSPNAGAGPGGSVSMPIPLLPRSVAQAHHHGGVGAPPRRRGRSGEAALRLSTACPLGRPAGCVLFFVTCYRLGRHWPPAMPLDRRWPVLPCVLM